jgi:hypothetical protein
MFRARAPIETGGRFYIADRFDCGHADGVVEPSIEVDYEYD